MSDTSASKHQRSPGNARPASSSFVRATEDGERIPLTIADSDAAEGWIAVVVQAVGKSTIMINSLRGGDAFADVAGPLGMASEIEQFGTVVVVGGGVGTAIAYPTAVALAEADNRVIAIIGGRDRDHVILEPELRKVCADVRPTTDDGSYGRHGFVTDELADIIAGEKVDRVIAIGPIPMMRAVADVTRPEDIPTIVSLNPIMVDGTGMCGGCRVSVGGETKFACVDGPEFDAHEVDFDLLAKRNTAYQPFEYYRTLEITSAAEEPTHG